MIGMGTGYRGGNRECNLTRAGKEKGVALIQYAYDRGIRMFDVVQNAVAMGNAPQAIKDLATAVTTNSEDDGIYNYLVENKIIKGL